MPQKKTIRCIGHEPIFIDANYRQPWSDVWVRFKTRPNKPRQYGPTLVSKSSLLLDLEITEKCQHDNPQLDYSGELLELRRAISSLEDQEVVIVDQDSKMPTLYTRGDFIDRAEAEKMLTAFIGQFGYSNLKFCWKRPKHIVIPIG